MFSALIFFTSDANTASGAAVESIQLAWRGERNNVQEVEHKNGTDAFRLWVL